MRRSQRAARHAKADELPDSRGFESIRQQDSCGQARGIYRTAVTSFRTVNPTEYQQTPINRSPDQ